MQKKCFWCNKIYFKKIKTSVKQWNKSKFCSIHCKSLWLGQKFKGEKSPVWINKKREKVCEVCYRDFLVDKPCLLEKRRFCSKKCFYNYRIGKVTWNKGKIEWKKCIGCRRLVRKWEKYCTKKCRVFNLPSPISLQKKCKLCQKEFNVRLSYKNQIYCSGICGRKAGGKTKTGIHHPFWGKHHSDETRNKISQKLKGLLAKENNPNWKGGITSFDKLERCRFRNQIQRKVFKRDNYTCQLCNQHGGFLQVDHIQSWEEYVELRFNIKNCRTLCMACHYFVTFGKPMPPTVRAWGHNFKEGSKYFSLTLGSGNFQRI